MDQQFEHLSDAQIENYGDPTGAGSNQPDNDQAIETHLSSCEDCRTRLLAFHRSRFGLMQGSASASPDCPSGDSLRNLAAGLIIDAHSASLLRHVAQCDHCGPILRAYTENFSDELSPADEVLLNHLNSASQSWQNKIAREMAEAAAAQPVASAAAIGSPGLLAAKQSASKSKPVAQPPSAVARRAKLGRFQLPGLKWLLLPATAVVCALIAFFIWNAQRETPEKVEKLLAQAYTEQRTMDMRWPGANYAPIRVTRGEGVRRFSKPNELLKAEKILTERQDNSSQTVDWLTARGEMELLNGRDQSAIDDLAKALTIEPESARIELLLGIAYAYNAELSESAGDREKALSYFTKVLNQEPANSAALFNRALLYQRAHDGQRAIADWKTLLSTEHDSAWAAEARRRMNEITSQVR